MFKLGILFEFMTELVRTLLVGESVERARSRRDTRRLRARSTDSPTRRVRTSSVMNSKRIPSLNMGQMVALVGDKVKAGKSGSVARDGKSAKFSRLCKSRLVG